MNQPEIMTILRDVLEVARLSQTKVTRAELGSPWGFYIDPAAELAVHIVERNSCWLHLKDGAGPLHLEEHDMAFIRDGVAHAVTDVPDSPQLPYQEGLHQARDRARIASRRGEPGVTRILCVKFSFEASFPHPLLSSLPEIFVVRASAVRRSRQLHLLTQLLAGETGEAIGSDLLQPRLVDGLLILLLRAWISEQPEESAGWVSALRNPQVARALSLLHERPHESWTVEELAHEVGQSRATFHRRFLELVGEPPGAYLGRWRMSLTAHLLQSSELSLDEIAARVGYESAAALSKAFRRTRGVAPGQFREAKRARATQ